jgi:hypothetical protein
MTVTTINLVEVNTHLPEEFADALEAEAAMQAEEMVMAAEVAPAQDEPVEEAPQGAIATVDPLNNIAAATQIAGSINTLRDDIRRQAELALDEAIAEHGAFTAVEREAMITVHSLKMVNGLDLVTVLLRGEFVRKIQTEGLLTVHPGQYVNLQDMAENQGISKSELSDTIALCDVIFPYIETVLQQSVAVMWEDIGKSKFRELVPLLRAVILGEEPASTQLRLTVERLREETVNTFAEMGRTHVPDAEITRAMVDTALSMGATFTVTNMRQALRPERTEPINVNVISFEGRRFILAELDEDQLTLFHRKMGSYADVLQIPLPNDEATRRIEAARFPLLRAIAGLAGR